MTNRLALSLVLIPLAACKCGAQIGGISESLGVQNWDAGAIGVGETIKGSVQLTATGSSAVTIFSVTPDAGDFTASLESDAGQVIINPGASASLFLTFTPSSPGAKQGTVVLATDNGDAPVQMTGTGIDLCATIGCDAGIAACAGACVNGGCQWPTGVCSDSAQCLTNGTCNDGLCQGFNDCVAGTGSCTSATNLTANGPTTGPDGGCGSPNGCGTCDPGTGACLFNPIPVVCDCGCEMLSDGGGLCNYNWVPLPGIPDTSYGSIWSSASGSVWVSSATTTVQGEYASQTVSELTNGTLTQQSTIPLGSNPVCGSGPSCSVALTGDTNGDVYGSYECTQLDSNNNCLDGGIWKWSGGAASFEPFSPSLFASACGQTNQVDEAVGYPVLLGGTAAVLNNNACGPYLMTEQNGAFTEVAGTRLEEQCTGEGQAIWGVSTTDFYVAWPCSNAGNGPGGIWHYTGNAYAAPFAFNSMDYANALAGTGDSDIWAVGSQRWHYDGNSWTESTPPPSPGDDNSLWAGVNGDYFASGSYIGIYHYTNGAWQQECLAPGYSESAGVVSQVTGDQNGNYYAGANNGIYQRQ